MAAPRRRWPREPFCAVSHGLGAILSAGGLLLLLWQARGNPWHVTSFALYGTSLIFLYGASALYHSLHTSERGAEVLMRLDHSAIYLLIAGTYAPVCLIALRGAWGWSLLGAEYAIAAVGIGSALLWRKAPDWWRVVLYLGMGWLVVLALGPLSRQLPAAGMAWLVAGGVTYSVGAVIYAIDRPHLWPGRFSAHDLWHLFVLGGSICHFVVVSAYLAHL
ncbi:MAG TPA: hemolysin III family protein [Armatimonadota bacterium]|jgi:hemolysin III